MWCWSILISTKGTFYLLVASVLRYPSPIPSNYSIFNWNFPRACSPKKGAKIFSSGQWFQCNWQSGWSQHQVYKWFESPPFVTFCHLFKFVNINFSLLLPIQHSYTSNRWRCYNLFLPSYAAARICTHVSRVEPWPRNFWRRLYQLSYHAGANLSRP